jgi:hypothetical protein
VLPWLRKTLTRYWRWLRADHDWRTWFIAWFGGTAVTAFQEHDPPYGWTALAIAVAVMVVPDLVALARMSIRKRRASRQS